MYETGRCLARILVVVAQDERHVRGPGDELEGAVGDGLEHLAEPLGRADPLLRVVEDVEPTALLDGRRGRLDVGDGADGEDVRVVRLGREGDDDLDQVVACAELDAIVGLEQRLAPVGVVERDALAAPHERRAVGRPEVLKQVAIGGAEDQRMLARDVLVREGEVQLGRAADPDLAGARLELVADRDTARDLELEHA